MAEPGSRQPKPLAGKQVVITRPRDQSATLAQALEAAGATVLALPTIAIRELPLSNGDQQCLRNTASYDIVLFTSANAVRLFAGRQEIEPQRGVFGQTSPLLASIGKATSSALAEYGWTPDIVATSSRAEGMLEALQPHVQKGTRLLFPRAKEAREILVETLESWGVVVDVLALYENVPARLPTEEVARLLAEPPWAIAFTSGSTVTSFLDAFPQEALRTAWSTVYAVAIGEVTATALRDVGWQRLLIAEETSVQGMVEALIRQSGE